jgi:type IV pilus assembly protein PilO
MDINLKELSASLTSQFQGLAGRHPGLWPLAPRVLCAIGVMAGVIGLGYWFYWSNQFDEYDQLAQAEQKLREEYKTKMAQAINLEALQAQKV